MSGTPASVARPRPNAHLRMSMPARGRLRDTETVQYRYYNDMGKSRGHCTWGIGVLAHRGVCTEEELRRVVTPAQVEAEFLRKVAEAEGGVHRNVHVELNQAQFDGLVSYTYNTGVGGARDTYKLLNANDFAGAGANMRKSVRVRVRSGQGTKMVEAGGLLKRRSEEAAPFLSRK